LTYAFQFAQRAERPCITTPDYRSHHHPETPHKHAHHGARQNRRPPLRKVQSSTIQLEAQSQQVQPEPRELEAHESALFQEMFLTSRARFVRVAYSILQNYEDAEDAVQNAFLSGFTHLRAFEGRSAFTTWFTRIVLNAALMLRRKHKNSRLDSLSSSPDDAPWVERIIGPHPDPEKLYVHAESCERINALLSKLKPILQQAFTLAYHHEMSGSEAAAHLGISTATFKSRLLRARNIVEKRASLLFARSNPATKNLPAPWGTRPSPQGSPSYSASPRQIPSYVGADL